MKTEQQFLSGGSLSNLIKLAGRFGPVDGSFLARFLYVCSITVLTKFSRVRERRLFHRRLNQTEVHKSPVFILGHWRTGTTYLHRLMARDSRFGFVSTMQTMIPELYLTSKLAGKILMASLPSMRPMDNVEVGPNLPEEDEYAMGNLSPFSFYHGLCFPRKLCEIVERNVLFNGVQEQVKNSWKTAYMTLLKKITYSSGGKRLLLKNPANTGRISLLLDLFPDARFIHIVRNPYTVLPSAIHWLREETGITSFQRISVENLEEAALAIYNQIMTTYLTQRFLIPAGHLCEVRFEGLEADPLSGIIKAYGEIGLELNDVTVSSFRRFIAEQAGYKKNDYPPDNRLMSLVEERWGFALEEWNYRRPRPGLPGIKASAPSESSRKGNKAIQL